MHVRLENISLGENKHSISKSLVQEPRNVEIFVYLFLLEIIVTEFLAIFIERKRVTGKSKQ